MFLSNSEVDVATNIVAGGNIWGDFWAEIIIVVTH